MFKKILVPTDGSETAFIAAKYARKIAENFGGEITLIHIIQNYYSLPTFSMPDTITLPFSALQDMETDGKTILEKTQEVFDGFAGQVSTLLDYGSPGKKIVSLAAEEKYSLIIMGRRGLNSVTGLLLGSVSNYIVQHSPCPILIVKNQEDLNQ